MMLLNLAVLNEANKPVNILSTLSGLAFKPVCGPV